MAVSLFEPYELGGMTLRNRVMMSPMSQNSASQTAEAGPWHLVHYGSRAVGGCGLILMEDTAVAENGRVSSRSLGLFNEAQAASLRPIVEFCKAQGSRVGIQLAHAGRKAYRDTRGGGIDLISTCEEGFDDRWSMPRCVATNEIQGLVSGFATSAALAASAGFDMIEIHAAHGYLIHQFLSPLTNKRMDAYGGSFANRSRFLLDVIEAIRNVWPNDRPIFCRVPAIDGHPGGLQREDVLALAAELKACGVHLIDVAAGNVSPACETVTPDQMKATAEAVRSTIDIPVAVAGASSADDAQSMVASRTCDLIAIGRPLLINPYWTLGAAAAAGDQEIIPKQYALAFPAKSERAA